MELITIIAAAACIIVAKLMFRFLMFRRLYNKLPGCVNTSLLLGDLASYPGYNEAGLSHDLELCKKHKYFYRMWFGPFDPVVFLCHPDVMRPVMKSSAPKPRNGVLLTAYDMLAKWLGESLVTANGAYWFRQRRLLTPAFHFDVLKDYLDIDNKCANTMLDSLEKLRKPGQSVEIYQFLNNMTLDIILRTAFSHDPDCQEGDTLSDYTAALGEIQELMVKRLFSPFFYIDFIYKLSSDGRRFYKLCDVTHKESEAIIALRRKQLNDKTEQTKPARKRDFLDILLTARDENGVGLTDQEIRNEVGTFLFAGHETTSNGSMWVLHDLAKHPEHQDVVYQEVMRIMGERDDLEWEDLTQLSFTTQCIKESLRLHSPALGVDKTLVDDVRVDGHVIPKGTDVTLHLWLLHHNPHVWEEPEEFRPGRFDPDNVKHMDPFQFMPFSAGQRNCIGQHFAMNELKVVVAKMIKRFKLVLDTTHSVEHSPSLTMRAKNGVCVFVTPRSDTV